MKYDYDLVVVGAGIHGVGVAQAAAAQGWRVLVLEATAIASGTSSRSSKLIHGGLRYLEGGHWRLVRESLRERTTLLRIAPDLVRLVPFHIPIYRESHRPAWLIRAGLMLYSLLGGRAAGRPASLPRERWNDLDGLSTQGLRAVFRYYDAQTDDAALTRAVMRSAQSLGAELRCPARLIGARKIPQGIEIDIQNTKVETVRARVLVNAAGPWVNDVLARVTPAVAMRDIDLVQGAHLVLPGHISHGAYYLEAPADARAVFVLPWHDSVLVGTTETAYAGDPAAAAPLDSEIDYLRAAVRRYFPHLDQAPRATFAGVRVLPRADGAFAQRSRETILHVDDDRRVLTIYGGKLTGYRATAERVLRKIVTQLPTRDARADTAQLKIS